MKVKLRALNHADAWIVYTRSVMKRGETGRRTSFLLTPLNVICLLCRFLVLYFLFLRVYCPASVHYFFAGRVGLSSAEQVRVLFLSKREGVSA